MNKLAFSVATLTFLWVIKNEETSCMLVTDISVFNIRTLSIIETII